MKNTQISVYTSKLDSASTFTRSLEEVFQAIENGTNLLTGDSIVDKLTHAREELQRGNVQAYKNVKAASQGYTFGGTFSYRKKENCTSYSGVIGLDIDLEGNEGLLEAPMGRQTVRLMLSQQRKVFAVFSSASGVGFRVLFKTSNTDPLRHNEVFLAAEEFLLKLGLKVDKSGKDVSRLSYHTYDPNIFVNWDAEIFEEMKAAVGGRPKKEVLAKSKEVKEKHQEKIKSEKSLQYRFVEQLIADKQVIWRDGNISDRDKWVKMIAACINEFGLVKGTAIAQEWSKVEVDKYDDEGFFKVIDSLDNPLTKFGSIIGMCRDAGIEVPSFKDEVLMTYEEGNLGSFITHKGQVREIYRVTDEYYETSVKDGLRYKHQAIGYSEVMKICGGDSNLKAAIRSYHGTVNYVCNTEDVLYRYMPSSGELLYNTYVRPNHKKGKKGATPADFRKINAIMRHIFHYSVGEGEPYTKDEYLHYAYVWLKLAYFYPYQAKPFYWLQSYGGKTGKDAFQIICEKLLYGSNTSIASIKKNDLEAKFTSWCLAVLAKMNEATLNNKECIDMIKDLITSIGNTLMKVEAKGKDPISAMLALTFVGASNKVSTSITLDEASADRWNIIGVKPLIGDTENNLGTITEEEILEEIPNLISYLEDLDITDMMKEAKEKGYRTFFDPKILRNSAWEDMRENSKPIAELHTERVIELMNNFLHDEDNLALVVKEGGYKEVNGCYHIPIMPSLIADTVNNVYSKNIKTGHVLEAMRTLGMNPETKGFRNPVVFNLTPDYMRVSRYSSKTDTVKQSVDRASVSVSDLPLSLRFASDDGGMKKYTLERYGNGDGTPRKLYYLEVKLS